MRIIALIPAAGTGTRVGGALPKQYQSVAGVPLIGYALRALAASGVVDTTYVVLAPGDTHFSSIAKGLDTPVSVLEVGGSTRAESVLNGLNALCAQDANIAPETWVLVHDAARPGLTAALVVRLVKALETDPVGGLLALPAADTLKREFEHARGHLVEVTLERRGLWHAQTPQMFRLGVLRDALELAVQSGRPITDESSALEALGHQPRLVLGSARNFKVTYPDDMQLAELMLQGER